MDVNVVLPVLASPVLASDSDVQWLAERSTVLASALDGLLRGSGATDLRFLFGARANSEGSTVAGQYPPVPHHPMGRSGNVLQWFVMGLIPPAPPDKTLALGLV